MSTKQTYIKLLSILILLTLASTSKIEASDKDSTYIADFARKYSFQVNLNSKNIMLIEEIEDEEKLTYRPNTPTSIGLGLSWKNSWLSLSFLQFSLNRDEDKINTKSYDFQYNYNNRKYIIDLYAQKYDGFYESETEASRPDIKIKRIGGLAQYIFNGKQFSYRSSFGYSERQLKSAGSWLAGLGLAYNKVSSDNFMLINNRIENIQITPAAGYIYTWIFDKRYFLTAGISGGANLTIDLRGEENLKSTAFVAPKISFGYHADDWTFAFNTVSYDSFLMMKETKTALLLSSKFEFVYVRRFDFSSKITDWASNLLSK